MYIAVLAKHEPRCTWTKSFSTRDLCRHFSKSLCQIMDENREGPSKPSEASFRR